jgi:hypothetical protein
VIDHGPWKKENRFNIEEEEEHGDQIELDGKSVSRCPHRLHATFVRSQFGERRLSHADTNEPITDTAANPPTRIKNIRTGAQLDSIRTPSAPSKQLLCQ